MMNLSENMIGRNYIVIRKDGKQFQGECISYIPAKDNEPEVDSISILKAKNLADEIFINEIDSIERIS